MNETPPTTPLVAGDPPQVGPYLLHGRMNTGGSGVTYAAPDGHGGWVALTVVRREHVAVPGFRSRFAHHVGLVRKVRSPGLAPLIAADQSAPLPWFATAYVPGPTVRDMVATHGPMPGGQVRDLAARIASTLADVHAAGAVYPNLTPAGVVLGPDGPVLAGFEAHVAAADSVGWVDPECFVGRLSSRIDMFSWGSVVAFAATGRAPFGTDDPDTVAHRHENGRPDLFGVPRDLAGPVAAALAPLADDRPDAAGLARALSGSVTPPPPPAPKRPSTGLLVALGAAVLAVLLGAALTLWAVGRDGGPPETGGSAVGAELEGPEEPTAGA
ncbi:hypothetical protein Q8791_21060 [Nocardiopsis sp. CT-R113]|uniref:Protein kinase domain-containing protein n=1 Tax=Nocardiopsis codii TaxID=3065942 RepID=A0ABU7KBV4_9ACTN|nr:hypothetical protein [Nocardiopsis sp. CT-R113]MEE2039713.1 hypothetical protein [Nocardiopsis sp. CT-R113]